MTQEEIETLKPGMHIIQMQDCCENIAGREYILGRPDPSSPMGAYINAKTGKELRNYCCCGNKWKLAAAPKPSLIKTIMKTLNNMEKLLLDPDTQKLKKAGLINGDLEITEAGKQELDFINFKAQKAELVKRAEEIIAEKEAETKKS